MSPFGKIGHKLTRFGGKMLSGTQKIGNKITHGLEKGLNVSDKVLGVVDKGLGALENVPIAGELVAPGRALIKQGKNVLHGASIGVEKLGGVNNKLQRIKL